MLIMKKCSIDNNAQKENVYSLRGAVVRKEHHNVCGVQIHKGHDPHRKQNHLPVTRWETLLHAEKTSSAPGGGFKLQ